MGVRFVPFPAPSSSGDQVVGEHSVPGGRCVLPPPCSQPPGLTTSPFPAPWFPGYAGRAPSQVGRVSPLGCWSLAVILLAHVNRPGSQEDLVSNWEPARSLVEDASLGQRLPLSSSGCRLPASLPPVGDGPIRCWLALPQYSLTPLFCERPGSALG